MKIVFIPGTRYLANPIFLNITDSLDNHELIYLDNKDSPHYLSGNHTDRSDTEVIRKKFNSYYDWAEFRDIKKLDSSNPAAKLYIYHKYKLDLLKGLNELEPDLIISNSDMLFSQQVALAWCKKNTRNYIVIQTAFFENTDKAKTLFYKLKYILFNKLLRVPIFRKGSIPGNESHYSHLFLWGEYFSEKLSKKNVHIVGNPLLIDDCKANRNQKRNLLICSDGMQNLKKIIGEKKFKEVMDIYNLLIKNTTDNIILKTHPGEDVEDLKRIFHLNEKTQIISNKGLDECLEESFVQLSVNSASSFHAVLMKTPIILIQPFDDQKMSDFFNNEIEIRVSSFEQLILALRKIKKDTYYKDFLYKRIFFLKKRVRYLGNDSRKRIAEKIVGIEHSNCEKRFRLFGSKNN